VSYVAIIGVKRVVVVDGKEEKAYKSIRVNPLFSPDSRRVAYEAEIGEKQVAVVDGKEEKFYDGFGDGSLIFSPDSRHVAYEAQDGTKQFAVVDGKEGRAYNGFLKGAKIVFDSANALHYIVVKQTIGLMGEIYLVEETID